MGLSQRRSRLVARLRQRKSREREGLVLVEGIRAVEESLDGGAQPRFAVVSPRLQQLPGGAPLLESLADAGIDLERAGDEELQRLSDTEHGQGVLLVCEEPAAGADVLVAGGWYVVLDAVQDPGNVGTLIRSAVGFGIDAVIALDGTADPWGPKAVRASAGSVFRVPVVRVDADEGLGALDRLESRLLLADPDGEDIDTLDIGSGGLALILGNEGSGPRPSVRAAAKELVRVPLAGSVESLNVGVAGSLLLYTLALRDARGA